MEVNSLLTEDQRDGVQALLEHSHWILNFGTGLGKTYTALASYVGRCKKNPELTQHLLVVCPKTGVGVWKKEIEERTDLTHFHCGAEVPKRLYDEMAMHQGDVTILEYAVAKKSINYLAKLYEAYNVILDPSFLSLLRYT